MADSDSERDKREWEAIEASSRAEMRGMNEARIAQLQRVAELEVGRSTREQREVERQEEARRLEEEKREEQRRTEASPCPSPVYHYNCYKCSDILAKKYGIVFDANEDDVREQIKQLLLQHHPNRGGDAEIFQEVSECAKIIRGNRCRLHCKITDENGKMYDDCDKNFYSGRRGYKVRATCIKRKNLKKKSLQCPRGKYYRRPYTVKSTCTLKDINSALKISEELTKEMEELVNTALYLMAKIHDDNDMIEKILDKSRITYPRKMPDYPWIRLYAPIRFNKYMVSIKDSFETIGMNRIIILKNK